MRHSDPSSNIAAYRAAAERLGEARDSAVQKRTVAEKNEDLVTGQKALDELRFALDQFKEIRNKLDSRELFLVRFNVREVAYGRVSLVLPKGGSRADVLEAAQSIAAEYYNKTIIEPTQFKKWCEEDRFKEVEHAPISIEIQGIVQGSVSKAFDDQKRHLAKAGFVVPSMRDLVVAHAVHFVATGRSMLSDLVIRTSDGGVRHYPYGMELENMWDVGKSFTFVAAAGAPMPRRSRWWGIFTRTFEE
jgi:hypothetical protein